MTCTIRLYNVFMVYIQCSHAYQYLSVSVIIKIMLMFPLELSKPNALKIILTAAFLLKMTFSVSYCPFPNLSYTLFW